ncbi:MAG: type II secretion system F family protein [Galactobacter sp.]
MNTINWAISSRLLLVALTLSLGGWLIADALIFSKTRRLGDRIAAQLGPTPHSAAGPWALVDRLLPLSATRRLSLETKLRLAGRTTDPLRHRATTVLSCTAVAAAMTVIFTIAATAGTLKPLPALIAFVGALVGVVMWRSTSLTRAATRKRAVIVSQFPLLADLLALGVAAGEAVAPALKRAAEETSGPLGEIVTRAVARTSTGVPLSTALRDLAAEAQAPALTDCVETILLAGERGTPLSTVLRDQAADARDLERRNLLEAGGKAEIRMLVPVVFGILPLSVLFAVFPSIDLITLSL